MIEPVYISAVEAIGWIAFMDFDGIEELLPEYYGTRGMGEFGIQDINRGQNKIIREKIENAKSDLLERLRAQEIEMWGYKKDGDGTCEIIPLAYLLHDNLDLAVAHNELWFKHEPYNRIPDKPDWQKLKLAKQTILKFWPKVQDEPQPEVEKVLKKAGRKIGSGGIKKLDEPFVLQMRELIIAGKFNNPHAAAVHILHDLKHSPTTKPESSIKRLMARYAALFSDNSEK